MDERRLRELKAACHENELGEQMEMMKRLVETSSTRATMSKTREEDISSGQGNVVLWKEMTSRHISHLNAS